MVPWTSCLSSTIYNKLSVNDIPIFVLGVLNCLLIVSTPPVVLYSNVKLGLW